MNFSHFSRLQRLGLGLAVLISLVVVEPAWSQRGRSDRFQRSGYRPVELLELLKDEKVAGLLALTAEQNEQLEKLRTERSEIIKKSPSISNGDMRQLYKDLDDRAIGILSENQKVNWEKYKSDAQANGDRGDRDRQDRGNPSNTDTTPKTQAETAPRVDKVVIPEEKVPEGAIAVSSFGAAAKSSKEREQGKDETISFDPQEPKLSFNFRYAAWADVLKLFADVNDLTLDLNDVPPGTFNYYDDRQYTMTEALDVINGYLYQKGYILVRRDRFLVCLNLENPIPPNVIPNVTEDELPKRGKNELMSLILPLEGLDAEKMVVEVRDLLGPQGKASAMKSTNSLVLTDIGSYLQRVSKLLRSGKPIDTRETAFRAIALKHISAAEAERTVRRLFGLNPVVTSTPSNFGRGFGGGGFPGGGFGGGGFGRGGDFGGGRGGDFGGGRGGDSGGGGFPGGGQGGGPPVGGSSPAASTQSPFAGKIQVTADTRTNHLLVTASGAMLKVVEDVVKALDSDTDSTGRALDQKDNPIYMKTYSVPGSDSSAVSRVLNNLIPGVVVGDDQRSGKIYVQGTKEEHAEVQKIIKESSGVSSDVTVIQLSKLDPTQVVNTMRNLYLNETSRAPSIEADAAGRRILVRGTADQLVQIRTLLRDMGESSASLSIDNGSSPERDHGTMRRLNLGNHNPEEILNLVQKTWDASGGAPIRVVIPSRANPIRDRRVPSDRPRNFGVESEENPPPAPPRRNSTKTERREPVVPSFKVGSSTSNSEKAVEVKPVSSQRPTTTQIIPRRVPVIQATQAVLEQPADGETEDLTDEKADDSPGEIVPTNNKDANREKRIGLADDGQNQAQVGPRAANEEVAPKIGVTVIGNEVILTSPDTKALDQLEEMITTLTAAIPQRTRWTVFYLRSADATDTAMLLERLFPQSSVASSVANDGMFGSLTNSFSSLGRGMLNATGLNQTLGGAQNLRIITDIRSNALFITGPEDVIRDVESMLELLDASELPQSGRDRLPRSIPVEYADVEEVADIIESVFKDSMGGDQPQQNQQGFNPLAAMFGGGRGGGGRNEPARKPQIELSLGVDRRTSHLIVSCNESMFQRIEAMVQAIDQRAKEANRTVRLVELKTADPLIVQSTLTSLIPKVTVSATRSNRSRRRTQDGKTAPGTQQAANPAPEATRDPQVIQRMMDQNNMQQGGGLQQGGGGFPGGFQGGGNNGYPGGRGGGGTGGSGRRRGN